MYYIYSKSGCSWSDQDLGSMFQLSTSAIPPGPEIRSRDPQDKGRRCGRRYVGGATCHATARGVAAQGAVQGDWGWLGSQFLVTT